MKKLTSSEEKQFLIALLDAFQSISELRIAVRHGLGVHLDDVVSIEANRRIVYFELIRWATSEGRLSELLKAALKEKPNNPALREFGLQVGVAPAVDASPHPVDGPVPGGSSGEVGSGADKWRRLNQRLLILAVILVLAVVSFTLVLRIRLVPGNGEPTPTRGVSPARTIAAAGNVTPTADVKQVALELEHPARVFSVAFSPDGTTLASGSFDKIVRLWRVDNGEHLRDFEGHDGPVQSVAFSPFGEPLASASDDKTVRLWQVSDGALQRTLTGPTDRVFSLAFSPDGKILAAGSNDFIIRLWYMEKLPGVVTREATDGISSVAFSPEGSVLATGANDSTIRLYAMHDDEKLIGSIASDGEGVNSLAYAPNGETLAAAYVDHHIRIWRMPERELLLTLTGHSDQVTAVAFSPDGKTLASASWDQKMRFWQTSDWSFIGELTGHTGFVSSLAFSPNGEALASGSFDNTVRLWPASDFRFGR